MTPDVRPPTRMMAVGAAAALGCVVALSVSCGGGPIPVSARPEPPSGAAAVSSRIQARLVTRVGDGLVAIHAEGETLQRVVHAVSAEMVVAIRLSPELAMLPVRVVLDEATVERALTALLVAAGVTDYAWVYQPVSDAAEPGAWVSIRLVRSGGSLVPGLFFLSDLQRLAESSLASWRGPGAEWTIRWQAYAAAASDLVTPGDSPSINRFDYVGQRSVSAEAGVRQRHPEMSEDQLIVVAADADGQPLLWRAIPDPRIVRAEGPSSTGELTGRVFHRAEAEIVIALPLDRATAELQIFQPRFTGSDWVLTRLGSVRLPPK